MTVLRVTIATSFTMLTSTNRTSRLTEQSFVSTCYLRYVCTQPTWSVARIYRGMSVSSCSSGRFFTFQTGSVSTDTSSVQICPRVVTGLIMMRWDYVSKLWPPTGLLFIPRVICEYGDPWWCWWWCWLGITPDSSTRALWQSYQQRHLGQVGGMYEGVRICLSVSEIPHGIFNTP
jgi:hypothetical protein